MLDQTVEIKLVTISTYEGFRKLISNLNKNITYIAYIHTHVSIYMCAYYIIWQFSGFVQKDITPLNWTDLQVFAGNTNLG